MPDTITIQTAAQVKEAFLTDLKALLTKYGHPKYGPATIGLEDHSRGWEGSNDHVVFDIEAIYDNDGNQIRERVGIDLERGI